MSVIIHVIVSALSFNASVLVQIPGKTAQTLSVTARRGIQSVYGGRKQSDESACCTAADLFPSRVFFLSFPSFSSRFFSSSCFWFLPVCLWFWGGGGLFFFRRGMTSMTEMACATSPSSASAAASSSSVRLRYQTVGPLYVCQAGWATLPHSYYALDYCSPK